MSVVLFLAFKLAIYFCFSIVLSIIAIFILRRRKEVPRQERDHQPFDYVGMVIFGVIIACLMLLMTQGFTYGLTSRFTLIVAIVGLIALVVFYIFEKGRPTPFIDFSIVKIEHFWAQQSIILCLTLG